MELQQAVKSVNEFCFITRRQIILTIYVVAYIEEQLRIAHTRGCHILPKLINDILAVEIFYLSD